MKKGGTKRMGVESSRKGCISKNRHHFLQDIEKPFDILLAYHIQFSTMLYQLILALEKANLFVPSLINNCNL